MTFSYDLCLPTTLREKLKTPLGILHRSNKEKSAEEQVKEIYQNRDTPIFVSVGDVCTLSLININYIPDLAIIDNKTLRGSFTISGLPYHTKKIASNPAGRITVEVWRVLREAIDFYLRRKERLYVEIQGEEDLLVLPLILELPSNSVIVYGQPHEGIVSLVVDNTLQEHAKRLLSQFEKC